MLFYRMRDSQERQGLRSAYRRPYGPRDNGNREKKKVEKDARRCHLLIHQKLNTSAFPSLVCSRGCLSLLKPLVQRHTDAADFWSSSDHKRSRRNKARGEYLSVCFDWKPDKYGYGHLLQTRSGLAAGYSRRPRQTSALLKTN